jgi:hypothetical protein
VHDVRLDTVGTFDALMEGGERLVTFGMGPDGDALALAVPAGDAGVPFARDETTSVAFAKSRANRPYTASALWLGGSTAKRIELDASRVRDPTSRISPPGGGWILGNVVVQFVRADLRAGTDRPCGSSSSASRR